MYFNNNIFIKKLLSLLLLITIVCPIFYPSLAEGFSFFGLLSEDTEKIKSATSINEIKQEKLMAVLVQEDLLKNSSLAEAIDRYAEDGAKSILGKSIIIPIPEDASVKEVYEGLAHLFFMGNDNDAKSKLVGVVLIGDVPIPVVEKDTHLWPTIFPYTDFEDRVYLWNKEKNRFVYEDGTKMEPEIWHGIIRSQKENLSLQEDEILKFLNENHKVHLGETEFSDNLFYVNTVKQQSLPNSLKTKYDKWLDFIEDITYMRFNKTLLSDLEEKENNSKDMPDVHTEIIIRQLIDDYLTLTESDENLLANMIGKTGAWEENFDTTIKLLTKKDLESVEKLKEINDLLEEFIYKQVKENNLAGDITIPHTIEIEDSETEEIIKKPLYWNGVLRKKITANDCSLYRGSKKNESHPYAQKVEANRTLNLLTAGSCVSQDAKDVEKYKDKYEGCCADNIEYNGSRVTYNYCDTGSEWFYGRVGIGEWDHQGAELPVFDMGGTQIKDGPDGASGCEELLTKENEDPDLMKRFDSLVLHIEPTQETIDKQNKTLAQSLPIDDPRGFSFYDYQNNFHRLDFLNIFDFKENYFSSKDQLKEAVESKLREKILEINQIIKTSSETNEKRYNKDKKLQYPVEVFKIPDGYKGNCDYTTKPEYIDKFTKKITWTESCKYSKILDKDDTSINKLEETENKIVRFYETGNPISLSLVDEILKEINFKKLYDSFNWLETPLNEKNKIIMKYALGEVSDFSSFLDYDFNGYELAHITTSVSDGSTFPIDFNFFTNDFDKDFYLKKAENLLEKIEYDDSLNNDSKKTKRKRQIKYSNKYLKSSLSRIFISKDDSKPIRITFSVYDRNGKINTKDYTTKVALNFSSSEIDDFFDIFPDKNLKVTAGKASFFLKPKKQNFGGKLTLQGYVPEDDSLLTEEIPIMITRYDTLMKTEKQDLNISDKDGTLLTVYIYDPEGKITKKFDGDYLEFITDDGLFQGGINKSKIESGKAEIRFFSGKKAGITTITAVHEKMKLPDSKIEINIKSEEPKYLKFKNDSKFLLQTLDYQNIIVQLVDEYDNEINKTNQELSWKIENGEIKNEKEKDENPRKKGVQEWLHTGSSAVEIRPKNQNQSKVRLSVISSILPSDRGISKEFTIVKNPILKTTINNKILSADSSKSVKIKLKAETENGELIKQDLKVNISVMPLDFFEYKNELTMKSGVGEFDFNPGTKAGKYTIIFSIDGFEDTSVEIEVTADIAKKLQMTSIKDTWDNDDLIPIDILAFDDFGNIVKNNEKITLELTKQTKELIDLPSSDLFLRNGKLTIGLKSKNKSGEAHLTVSANNMEGDTLKLLIEDKLSVEEISKNFKPKVKFMILSGAVGGNLFLDKNIATELLFSGKTQAISTMGVEYENSSLGYGFVGAEGNVSELLDTKFIFEQKFPTILLSSNDKILAKIRLIYKNNPRFFLGEVGNSYGIYLYSEKNKFDFNNKNELFFEEEKILSFTKEGGINIFSGGIDLKISKDNLKKWDIRKDGEVIGTITYNLPNEISINKKDEFQGLWLKDINADMNFNYIFTGNSTAGKKGFSIEDKLELSSFEKRLGSLKTSIEESQSDSDIVWGNSNWKPATLFAGGNNIGTSVQRGSSDVALLLGDPTLSRNKDSLINDKTVGISLWKSLDGDIENLSYSDLNKDGNLDLVLQINNKIKVLYQTKNGHGNFAEDVTLSTVTDGVKSISSLINLSDNETLKDENKDQNIEGFIQINEKGDFILHQIIDGSVVKKKLPFGQKFEKIKTANLNGDAYVDIVGIDKNQKLWRILGEKDGFDKPKLLTDLSPKFDKVNEKSSDKTTSYLSGIKISYKTKKEEINSENLSDSELISTLKINSDDRKLRIGGKLSTELNITIPNDLSDISITIPAYKNIEFEKNTFDCFYCKTKPTIKTDLKTGGVIISNLKLKTNSKLLLTWKSKVKSLESPDFFIGDFENGKDNLDDISIPWNFSGRNKVLKFLSSKQQTQLNHNLIASLENIINSSFNIEIDNLIFNKKKQELLSLNKTLAFTEVESSTDTNSTKIKSDIEEELSKYLTDTEIDSLLSSLTKNLKVPSEAFTAPGLNFDKLLSIPDGTMSNGSPVIDEKTYRLYIMPTTTGKLTLGYCTGIKSEFMVPPIWNPNCYVKVLNTDDIEDSGTITDTELTSLTSGDEVVVATITSNKEKESGIFSLETKYSSNKNLPAVDIITQWLKDQWRELTYNIPRAMPRVSFRPPDFTLSPSNDELNTDLNKYDELQQKLLKYKFINIQKIPVVISIPDFDKLLEKKDLSEVISVDIDVDIDLSGIKKSIGNLEKYPDIIADIEKQLSDYKKEQKKLLENQLEAKVEEFIKDYETLKESLLSLRKIKIELFEKALVLAEDLTAYFDSWLSKMDEKIEEWEDFANAWSDLSFNLTEITIDFFNFFEDKFGTKAVDRGMSISWLFNIMVGSIDLPVITIPTFPDITVDLSNIQLGADIKIPDVELKKTDMDLHELFDISIPISLDASDVLISGDKIILDLPTLNLPNINLPEIPIITLPETDLSINFPNLPTIPSPPQIPTEIVKAINTIMNIPTSFASLFGMLRLGAFPVPEWYLKAYVENLTNEISLDLFFDLSLDSAPINASIPDINISPDIDGRIELDFFEFLKELFETDTTQVNKILKNSKSLVKINNDLFKLQKFLANNVVSDRISLHNKFEQEKKETRNLYKKLVLENNLLKELSKKSAKEFFAHKSVENIFMKNNKYFTSNESQDTIGSQEIKTVTLTKEDEMNRYKKYSSESSSLENGIYLVDKETGKLSKLVNQELENKINVIVKDIDNDGVEEIYYTNGSELFVKYNSNRTPQTIENKKVGKWTYEIFKSKREVASGIEVNNKSAFFKPFDKDISYYEFFFSDRSDSLFELTLFPSERKSKIWKRFGLAKQNLFKNYKISKIPARVVKIKGSPKINMVRPKELMTYSEKKCKNPDVKKSFFSSRTILMATEDDTRISIRVPAIAFKPAEYQIIRLEKGESTSIDYGKVCVFSGKLESADLSEDKELFDLKVGQIITSDMELQMDDRDFVQFQTSGNSLVSIFGEDEYQLRFFNEKEPNITLMLKENDLIQNLYGFLIGFIDEQKTLVRRKIFFNAID